ncbi:MAG TPA: DEAD/DEAH box helicase [Candidatus Nanoarchaeia archaeon]|nr:DEAD/DEAH box helicase [Candidatus Nanoarchaeia archaeon]
MIKGFTPRLYQQTILATAVAKNTLVVLPTGMGKTNIFLMLASQRLAQYPSSKVLLIGPTKPLIDQYHAVFRELFDIELSKMAIFTGQVSPEKRQELWKTSSIIFSTPQGLENDVISRKINLEEVSLLGFDEAHRAVGNYSYVFLASQYHKLAKYPRIVGMTASPGTAMDEIREVCQNLHIEAIEVRTDKDPDVAPYVQEVQIDWIKVSLPPIMKEVQKPLQDFLKSRMERLRGLGLLSKRGFSAMNKTDLLSMQAELRMKLSQGENDFSILTGISVLAEIMKVSHAIELLETQGIISFQKYVEKLYEEARAGSSKAIANVVSDEHFKTAVLMASKLYEGKIEHPKLIELQKIVDKKFKENKFARIMVFNQYRDNAADIVAKLNTIPGVSAQIFVGQQKKGGTGISQKEQKKLVEDFRNGFFNVLVATSIGEEGLDIPKVDCVIFFEPVPSAIRQIQRRGRTGRLEKGSVIILMTQDTRDEAYRWVAVNKEKKMHSNLELLRRSIGFELKKQEPKKKEESLSSYMRKDEEIIIYADYREKGSGVIRELAQSGVVVKLETLPYADYVLSKRVGVEFKKVDDFVQSIIDGRLMQQAKDLRNSFERPMIIIEGEQNLYGARGVHPNAIMGMLATLTVSFGIPILQTKNHMETSLLIRIIAKREQEEVGRDFSMHADRKPLTIKEQQEYVVSSLPGVGPVLAKPLLKHFKSIKNLCNASLYDLQDVEKIGKIKAQDIKKVVDEEYRE